MISKPEFIREYEALLLESGDLILNGLYGKQIRIKKNQDLTRSLLALCSGKDDWDSIVEKMLSKYQNIKIRDLEVLIKNLINIGVIDESLAERRPDKIDKNLYSRFESQISHLQSRLGKGSDPFKAFERLREARIIIIGAGGNGSMIAMMLAAMGVGHLHLIDGDYVEESNLTRQIFYSENDVIFRKKKVEALSDRISQLTKYTCVSYCDRYMESKEDILEEIPHATCVALCADAPRFIINRWVNEACFELDIPHINAFCGLVGPFVIPKKTACFSCLENHFRKVFGVDHDHIVNALQMQRTRQYPSFVTGPVSVANIQVSEIVSYILGDVPPRSINALIRPGSVNRFLEVIEQDSFCSTCSSFIS